MPSRARHAGFRRHVGEGAVSIVVVQNAVGILRDVEVGKAVAVVVANGDAHAVGVSGDAGFLGHIGESAVAIIAIERVAQRLRRL